MTKQCTIGTLLRQIRESRGHSLRQAAEYTGLDRNLLRRLELNCRVRQLEQHLLRFAAAYGTDLQVLIRDTSPLGGFRSYLAAVPPVARALLLWGGPGQRMRLTLDFFASPVGGNLDRGAVAKMAGCSLADMERALTPAGDYTPLCQRVSEVICWKIGLPIIWFRCGLLPGETGFDGVIEFCQHRVAAAQAHRPGASAFAPVNRLRQLYEASGSTT